MSDKTTDQPMENDDASTMILEGGERPDNTKNLGENSEKGNVEENAVNTKPAKLVYTKKQRKLLTKLLKAGVAYPIARQQALELKDEDDQNGVKQKTEENKSEMSEIKVSIMHPDFPNVLLNIEKLKKLRKSILDKIDELPEDGIKVCCWFARHAPGYLTVLCSNMVSKNWLIESLKNIEIDGVLLKVVEGHDLPVPPCVEAVIKDDDEDVETPPEKILARIKKMNEGFETENWVVLRSEKLNISRRWTFIVDEKSLQILKDRGFKACYVLGQIDFRMVKKYHEQLSNEVCNKTDVMPEDKKAQSKKLSGSARKRVQRLVDQGMDRETAKQQVMSYTTDQANKPEKLKKFKPNYKPRGGLQHAVNSRNTNFNPRGNITRMRPQSLMDINPSRIGYGMPSYNNSRYQDELFHSSYGTRGFRSQDRFDLRQPYRSGNESFRDFSDRQRLNDFDLSQPYRLEDCIDRRVLDRFSDNSNTLSRMSARNMNQFSSYGFNEDMDRYFKF